LIENDQASGTSELGRCSHGGIARCDA
jgi:hypothetical protein